MDAVDIAQRQQEMLLALQLAKAHAMAGSQDNQANFQNTDGDYECIDCGELVEPQRVKLGLTLRCIACQTKLENKQCNR